MFEIAILISGHLRTFKDRYPSFIRNILLPLKEIGEVNVMISTWDVIGYRQGLNIIEDKECSRETNRLISDLIEKQGGAWEIEPFNREKFQKEYNSEGWRKNPSLSGPQTAGDAACMWYKVNQACKLLGKVNYDLVVKVRPDIEYSSMINIEEVMECLRDHNLLYVPKFDGKYNSVRKGMVDHLAFGSLKVMKYYCSLFERIEEYLKDDNCIHTGEGFLAFHLEKNPEIKVKRTELKYEIINNK